MRKALLVLTALCLLLSTGAYAQWTTVFQTGYDNPPYVLGSTVNGVDGWTVTVNTTLSTVQKEADPSTNQFDYISGASTFSTYRAIPTVGTGYRVRLSFTWLMAAADLKSNDPAYGLWTMFTKTTDPASNRSGMLGGNYDSTTGIGTFKAFNSGPGWTAFGSFALNIPYQLTMDVDMTSKTYDVYLNGVQKLTGLNFYTAGLDSIGYLHFYRRYQAGSYAIDNVLVESAPVPEPSSLAALACGLTGLAGYIRRRR